MPAYKDTAKNTWFVSFYYKNWNGVRKKKMKRGFPTKRDALAWEKDFLLQKSADLSMEFEKFLEIYAADRRERLRENTWTTKDYILRTKILPYFRELRLNEIQAKDVIAWQNEMLKARDRHGKTYSPTYLKTLHNQLSAVFNHAVKYYGLKSNPASAAGNMGNEKHKEMLFWTKEEYLQFLDSIRENACSFCAFELLYWCGIREGELLALTASDFDFSRNTLSITKSYQRLGKRDIITDPKTPKSIRIIQMPGFLAEELFSYLNSLNCLQPGERIFPITKHYLYREMKRGTQQTGVKRIRIHDLRHSHVSLLIEMGFSALAIAERLGHESITITYRYAHLYPSKQEEMARRLNLEREKTSGA